MSLLSLLAIAIAVGIASALAGRTELRVSPRPALLTRTFGAFAIFIAVLLVPISVYFYVFHGDWYLLYFVDARRIPSALALLGFMAHGAVGAVGFLAGASLVRSQKDALCAFLAAFALALAASVYLIAAERLSVVGSYAQYHRGFGLAAVGDSTVLGGGVLMGAILLLGGVLLLARIRWGTRRSD